VVNIPLLLTVIENQIINVQPLQAMYYEMSVHDQKKYVSMVEAMLIHGSKGRRHALISSSMAIALSSMPIGSLTSS
jgi:hypothetical protein